MVKQRCGSCRYFEDANLAGSGWCHHPQRKTTSDLLIMVRRNELACRDEWSHSLWEPGAFEPAPATHRPTAAERRVAPASESEIAALLRPPAPAAPAEDVVLGEARLTSEAGRPPTFPGPPHQPGGPPRVSLLDLDTGTAIKRARETYRERSRQLAKLASEVPVPTDSGTSDLETDEPLDGDASLGNALPAAQVHGAAALSMAEPEPLESSSGYLSGGARPRLDSDAISTPLMADDLDAVDWVRQGIVPGAPSESDYPADLEAESDYPADLEAEVAGVEVDREPGDNESSADDPDIQGTDVEGRDGVAAIVDRLAVNGIGFSADWRLDSPPRATSADPRAVVESESADAERARLPQSVRRIETPWSVATARYGTEPSGAIHPSRADAPGLDLDWSGFRAELVPTVDELAADSVRPPSRGVVDLPSAPDVEAGDATWSIADIVGGVDPGRDLDRLASDDAVAALGVVDEDETWTTTALSTVAAGVPRMCRTCRSYRPGDGGERGWCANQWAFTHRRLVEPDEPEPCETSLGSWWLPADDVCLAAADISAHGQPTPLLDRWLPRHRDRPAERKRS